jgi:hypothetical protein
LNLPSNVGLSPHLTALRCVFLVALHHGVQVAPEKLSEADAGLFNAMRQPAL